MFLTGIHFLFPILLVICCWLILEKQWVPLPKNQRTSYKISNCNIQTTFFFSEFIAVKLLWQLKIVQNGIIAQERTVMPPPLCSQGRVDQHQGPFTSSVYFWGCKALLSNTLTLLVSSGSPRHWTIKYRAVTSGMSWLQCCGSTLAESEPCLLVLLFFLFFFNFF